MREVVDRLQRFIGYGAHFFESAEDLREEATRIVTVKEVGIPFDNNEAFINDEGRKNGEKATKIQKKGEKRINSAFFYIFFKKRLDKP